MNLRHFSRSDNFVSCFSTILAVILLTKYDIVDAILPQFNSSFSRFIASLQSKAWNSNNTPTIFSSGNLAERAFAGDSKFGTSICHSLNYEECANTTIFTSIQVISQRDAQLNTTVSDVLYLGLNFNTAIFDTHGYSHEVLDLIPQVLFLGFITFSLDLYWNEAIMNWQLCPFDISNPSAMYNEETETYTLNGIGCSKDLILLKNFVVQLERFMDSTTNDLTTSISQIHFKLHSLNNTVPAKSLKDVPNSSRISQIIRSHLIKYIYTPELLEEDRRSNETYGIMGAIRDTVTGLPKLYRILLSYQRRVIFSYANYTLSPLSSYTTSLFDQDSDYLFQSVYTPERKEEDVSIPYSTLIIPNLFEMDMISTDDFPAPNCMDMSIDDYQDAIFQEFGVNSSLETVISKQLSPRRSNFSIIITDTNTNPFTNESLQKYIECGFVPFFTRSRSRIDEFLPFSRAAVWSWDSDQPSVPEHIQFNNNKNETEDMGSIGDYEKVLKDLNGVVPDKRSVWRCAVMDSNGWRVENCFEKHPVLCAPIIKENMFKFEGGNIVNTTEALEYLLSWSFGEYETNYFEATDACPSGTHEFSLPQTITQDTAARLFIKSNSSFSAPVWIDFNSINTEDCWVTGGPGAQCPYVINQWGRSRVVSIAVAGLVSLVLLIAAFLITLDKVPIRHSEGKFRKIFTKFNENQYQGVPS